MVHPVWKIKCTHVAVHLALNIAKSLSRHALSAERIQQTKLKSRKHTEKTEQASHPIGSAGIVCVAGALGGWLEITIGISLWIWNYISKNCAKGFSGVSVTMARNVRQSLYYSLIPRRFLNRL